jgi:hypothetical protein
MRQASSHRDTSQASREEGGGGERGRARSDGPSSWGDAAVQRSRGCLPHLRNDRGVSSCKATGDPSVGDGGVILQKIHHIDRPKGRVVGALRG